MMLPSSANQSGVTTATPVLRKVVRLKNRARRSCSGTLDVLCVITGDISFYVLLDNPLKSLYLKNSARRRQGKERGCRGTQSHGRGRGGVPRLFPPPLRGPLQAGRGSTKLKS